MSKLPIYILLPCVWIATFIGFSIIAAVHIDPDYGLHHRLGEYLVKVGFPKSDPFSYTMPSYHLIDHEWLTNVIFYWWHQNLGFVSLNLLFSFLSLLAIYLASFKANPKWRLVVLLLSASIASNLVGARPQIITLVFFSILILLQTNREYWRKWRFVLPILFLIWVNLHGGFAIGLAVTGLYIAIQTVINRRLDWVDMGIFLVSVAATAANPYSVMIWKEIWDTSTDTKLRWTVQEWAPMILTFNLPFLIFTCLASSFIFKYWRQLPLHQLIISSLLLLGTLSNQRHASLYVLATIPLLVKSLDLFYQQVQHSKQAMIRFKASYKGLLVIALTIWSLSMALDIRSAILLSEVNFYPQQAIDYLRANPDGGRYYAPYYWGSYLIWKYPEERVFIYGSMPSWKRQVALPGESLYAFDDYLKVESQEGYLDTMFNQYNITRVLWSQPITSSNPLLVTFTKINNHLENQVNPKSIPQDMHELLKKRGWQVVYQDNISIIYQKPTPYVQ